MADLIDPSTGKWWECQCCGMKYRKEIANQFDTCPNCGLELGETEDLEELSEVVRPIDSQTVTSECLKEVK